jgi:Ala-tRNA(Pro) deacylase
MKIKQLLDGRRVAYRTYRHERTYDSQHLAEAPRVPGEHVAKTVLLRVDRGYRDMIAVLPATKKLDLAKVSRALNGADVRLADKREIALHCPECEFGVLPPFGSPFAMETLVDESLSRHKDLFFQGDSHDESIRMSYDDFYNVEHPLVVSIIETESPVQAKGTEPQGI